MLPYIDMRGIPAERYQGNVDLLSEVEMRWDVVRRWSVMAYAGAGKAFDDGISSLKLIGRGVLEPVFGICWRENLN
jgi:hypothetical protein